MGTLGHSYASPRRTTTRRAIAEGTVLLIAALICVALLLGALGG